MLLYSKKDAKSENFFKTSIIPILLFHGLKISIKPLKKLYFLHFQIRNSEAREPKIQSHTEF